MQKRIHFLHRFFFLLLVWSFSTLLFAQEITASASFSPGAIGPSTSSLYELVLENNGVQPLADFEATVSLPPGLTFLLGTSSNTCNASLAISSSSLTLTAGRLGAGSSCEIKVWTFAAAAGAFDATLEPMVASASLIVDDNLPSISATFSESTVLFGEEVALEIEVDNSRSSVALEDLGLNIGLPRGLSLAVPRVWQNSCGGEFFSSVDDGVAGFNTGFVPAMTSCILSTRVKATATGSQKVLVSFADFFNFNIRLGGTAVANVNVGFPTGLWVQPSFGDDVVGGGETLSLSFDVQNFSRESSLSEINFEVDLDAMLSGLVAVNIGGSVSCGANAALSGLGQVRFSGGQLEPMTACSFQIDVAVPEGVGNGTYLLVPTPTSAMSEGRALNGETLPARLVVELHPEFSGVFNPSVVAAGGESDLLLTLQNPSSEILSGSFQVTSPLDFLGTTTLLSWPANGFCGAFSSISSVGVNDDSIWEMANLEIAAGETCLLPIHISLDPGFSTQSLRFQASDFIGAFGNTPVSTAGFAADLSVVSAPNFILKVLGSPLVPGAEVLLSIEISQNETAPGTATLMAFELDLDAVIPGWIATGLPRQHLCGLGSTLNGTSTITFANGTLESNQSCRFDVVTRLPIDAVAGEYGVQSGPLNVELNGMVLQTEPTVAPMLISGIRFQRTLSPQVAQPGSLMTVTYQLSNALGSPPLSNGSFQDFSTDDFPFSVVDSSLPAAGSCGASSTFLHPVPDVSQFLVDGITLAAGESCSFSVDVVVDEAAPLGEYQLPASFFGDLGAGSIPLGRFSSTFFIADSLMLSMAFVEEAALLTSTAHLQMSLANAMLTESASEISFDVDVEAVLPGALFVGLPISSPCGEGSRLESVVESEAASAGAVRLVLGQLAPVSSCSFALNVELPASFIGERILLTSSEVDALLDGMQRIFASDTASLAISKILLSHEVQGRRVPGALLDFVLQLDNPGSMEIDGMRLGVVIDANLSGAAVEGNATFDGCGSVAVLTSRDTFGVNDVATNAGDGCTMRVPVRIPFETVPGIYSSTTTSVGGGSAQLSPGVTATFEILPLAPLLEFSFGERALFPGQSTQVVFTIDNSKSVLRSEDVEVNVALPDHLQISSVPNASSTCGVAFSPLSESATFSSAGVSLAPGDTCSLFVDVTALGIGDAPLVANGTSSVGTSEESQAVLLGSSFPSGQQRVDPANLVVQSRGTWQLSLEHVSGTKNIDDLSASFSVPAGLTASTSDAPQCGGSVAVDGENVLFSGALDAGSSCTFSLDIVAETTGVFTFDDVQVSFSGGTFLATGVTLSVLKSDRDGDGVFDDDDSDPDDAFRCADLDNDGCDDCSQTGADGSGGDVNNDGEDGDGDGQCDVDFDGGMNVPDVLEPSPGPNESDPDCSCSVSVTAPSSKAESWLLFGLLFLGLQRMRKSTNYKNRTK